MKERFIELLKSTELPGIDNLIQAMEDGGFFTAPCSSKYHLCVEGGLLEHSLNVYETFRKINRGLGAKIPHKDIVICSLLHDLGKMGDYGKPNYVVNMVNSKTKNKDTGLYDKVRSDAQPFKHNPELIAEEHELRSVIIASRYIKLTETQANAILHHNGLYGKLDSVLGNQNYTHDKLAYLLHVADMYCSRFSEE